MSEPGLGQIDQPAWRGTCRSAWALPLTAIFLGSIAVFALLQPGMVVLSVILTLTMAFFVSVRATAGPFGLRVRSGAAPWPSVHIPLADIREVEAIDVRPLQWGGWGYRGSVKLFKRAAWLLRAGPGIKVTLDEGRVFLVTVDDAEAGAEVLRQLLTRGSGRAA